MATAEYFHRDIDNHLIENGDRVEIDKSGSPYNGEQGEDKYF